MRIAIITNHDWFFLSHRLPIAIEAIKNGHEVFLLAIDTGKRSYIENMGIKFINIPLSPTGKNPLEELKTFIELRKIYKEIKPDVIHHITMKVSLLGSLAAKSLSIRSVVNAISGFGYAFTDGRTGLLQRAIKLEMDFAFKSKNFHFILQNPFDMEQLRSLKYVPDGNIHLIKGSGVDLKQYSYTELPNNEKIEILFPARILGDKGVIEIIEAMKLLRPRLEKKAKLVLAGDCTATNPTKIPEDELKTMLIDGYIEWIGYQSNMVPVYQHADIVALPSYREGLPKSLIEACAIGRPIITTNVPGCRECVTDGYNGIMVEAKTVEPLANAILTLVENPDLRQKYGKNSRELAEKEFSIENVVDRHLKIYKTLFNRN